MRDSNHAPRLMAARFAGPCAAGCGQSIRKGDSIVWSPSDRTATHARCDQATANAARAQAEATRRFQAEADADSYALYGEGGRI